MVAWADIPAAIMDAQPAAAVATDGKALQQGGTVPHSPARLLTSQDVRRICAPMRLRTGVRIDTHAVGLEGLPVDEARMVVADQDRPLIAGQPARSAPHVALIVNIPFKAGAAIGIGAGVAGMDEDAVDGMVGGDDPAHLPAQRPRVL